MRRTAQGWDLVRDGFEDFDAGSWQPPVIVLAGGALLVLGLLMFLPARGHRTLGVLALLVTLAALVGVVVLLNLLPVHLGLLRGRLLGRRARSPCWACSAASRRC